MQDTPYHVINVKDDYEGYGHCSILTNMTLQEYASLKSAETAACKLSNCWPEIKWAVVYKYSGKILLVV